MHARAKAAADGTSTSSALSRGPGPAAALAAQRRLPVPALRLVGSALCAPVGTAEVTRASAVPFDRSGHQQAAKRPIMIRLRAFFLGLAATAASSRPPLRPPTSAAPSAAASAKSPMYRYQAPFSWTGFYVGTHLGYGWSDVDWQETGPAFNGSHDGSGVLAGGQIGYNWQAGRFVYGVEGDISGQLGRRRQRLLRPQHQLAGVGARPRRPHRLRQPHAVLRDGRRRLGRRRLFLDRLPSPTRISAGSRARASSARSRPTCRRGSSTSTTTSTTSRRAGRRGRPRRQPQLGPQHAHRALRPELQVLKALQARAGIGQGLALASGSPIAFAAASASGMTVRLTGSL